MAKNADQTRMRMLAVFVALVALSGCEKQSAKEIERLEIASKGERDNRVICEQQRKVAAAFLEERNEAAYQVWKLRADTSCMTAMNEPYNMQGLEADNLAAE